MKLYNITLSCQAMVEAENPEDAEEFALTLLADGELLPTDIEVEEV